MKDNRQGALWMVGAVLGFAVQDGFSRYLAENYSTLMTVTLRYWIFLIFVLGLALRRPEGFRAAVATKSLPMHGLRALLILGDIGMMVLAFTLMGLVETHAVFAICPLLIVALSGPLLGERLTFGRWMAVAVGLFGVLLILRPGAGVFTLTALLPLGAALLFALYGILTRKVSRSEASFPMFFWPPVIGTFVVSIFGVWSLEPVALQDIPVFLIYGAISILGNWAMQRAYQLGEASSLQPFAYLITVFASIVGIVAFGDNLALPVAFGAAVVIGAGIYAARLERKGA